MVEFFKKLFGSKEQIDFKAIVGKGALIIDVRSPAEFSEGHLNGSINIPLNQVQQKVNELKKKQKPVITVCRSGARSKMACSVLKNSGIEAYNGGAWTGLKHKLSV